MSTNEKTELLLELCKSQLKTLHFVNKIMFETTKHQMKLSKKDTNTELLDLAWSTNDVISDNPREKEIIKALREKFDISLVNSTDKECIN